MLTLLLFCILMIAMKLSCSIAIAITFWLYPKQIAISLGCDTQERISWDLGDNCSDFSTQRSSEITVQQQICLDASLSGAIAIYKDKRNIDLARWLENNSQGIIQQSEDFFQLSLRSSRQHFQVAPASCK
jgi:hypothetical protein